MGKMPAHLRLHERRLEHLSAIRRLFAPLDDPYAGADLENAKRLGAVLWLIVGGIAVLLMPFSPPTEAIGAAGWAITAMLVAICLAGTRRIRAEDTGFDDLLVSSYIGIAGIAVLEWLAGGGPYDQLYLLLFLYSVAVHPPRRAAICLAVGSAAYLAPLAYDQFTLGALASGMSQLLIWWGISVVAIVLMVGVRAQRVRSKEESRLARVDSLTRLGNRRAFEEALERETSRVNRRSVPLSLLLADVNGFKRINDAFGHPFGDDCLRRVAEALKLTVRGEDLCFRWGGDEFAVLLPETSLEGAQEVRERLLATVRAARLGPAATPIEVCCGIACVDGVGSQAQLVEQADADLLLFKRRAQQPVNGENPTTPVEPHAVG
jgi:diguanylate cyclase (GGDEF)-like protein